MKTRVLSIMIILAACIAASAGLAEDAFAKQIQVVTARGNVFSLVDSEVGWMNNSTGGGTTIITNTIIQALNSTGAGVGFGYLPQIVIHDTPGAMMLWGNSTHVGHGAERPYMREGTLDFAGIVEQDDRSVTIPLPTFSGEYRLQGEDRLTGSNDIIEDTYSSWDNTGGWLELTGDSTIGGPNTAVARLQDYQLTRQPINITGWASPGTTVSIVSSPNDLTQHTVVGEEFAPEIQDMTSSLNYTSEVIDELRVSSSHLWSTYAQTDYIECVPGRYDGYTNGYRCHYSAYPSYPATLSTDFYAKDCNAVIERATNSGGTVLENVAKGIELGYTTQYGHHNNQPGDPDLRQVTMTELPTTHCGPKNDDYYHVSMVEVNNTKSFTRHYLFGPHAGTSSQIDLPLEVNGNITLNTSDHDVHFTGTGLFEEEIDLQKTTTVATTVVVKMSLNPSTSSRYAYYYLESPDGQQHSICNFVCRGDITRTLTFENAPIVGDWKVYGKKTSLFAASHLYSWSLTIGTVDFPERTLSPAYYPSSWASYTLADTLTVPNTGPYTKYRGDLYLMATGMASDDNIVRIRGTDTVDPAQLIIRGMDPHTPYQITDNGAPIKTGMASRSGVIEIPRGEVDISILNGPIVFTYWPDATTYDGYAHTSNRGIMFDPYNDEVVEFPWETDDPLLYVAKAYVKMTFPVDGTELGGAKISGDRGSVTYAYVRGTYDAGDEVFIPIFPGARTIHLQINGEWVQSYIKDVQQNSSAVTFDSNRGDRTTASATMFATKPGVAIALVSADLGTSSSAYLITNVVNPGDGRIGAATDITSCTNWPSTVSSATFDLWQYKAAVTRSLGSAGGGSATLFVEVYHNGEHVQTVNGTTSGVSGYTTRGLFSDEAEPPEPYTLPDGYRPTNYRYLIQEYGDFSGSNWCTYMHVTRYYTTVSYDMASSQLWSSSHAVSPIFSGGGITKSITVQDVEPGDQIDFVLRSTSTGITIDYPVLPWAGSVTIIDDSILNLSGSTIDSGYILLFQ